MNQPGFSAAVRIYYDVLLTLACSVDTCLAVTPEFLLCRWDGDCWSLMEIRH